MVHIIKSAKQIRKVSRCTIYKTRWYFSMNNTFGYGTDLMGKNNVSRENSHLVGEKY